MDELKIFENEQFGTIRAIEKDGEPWFVAADVCRALELEDTGRATSRLDDDELTRIKIVSGGQSREVIAVNEPGLYSLVLGSRKPEAKAFKRWITHDVIPSIRKHGAYMTPDTIEKLISNPDTIIQLATALKEEQEKRKALEAENEAQRQALADFQPIKQYVDTILSSDRTLTTTQIAADYDMTARQLNRILHEDGIQHKVNGQWILYKKHMGKGYTKSKTIQITHNDGRPDTVLNTEWTQKGRLLIHEILTARGILAVMDRMAA